MQKTPVVNFVSGLLRPVGRKVGSVVAKFKPDEPLLTRAVNLKKDSKKSAYVTKNKNGYLAQ